MVVASLHIPVMGPSNTPCSELPASATNTFCEQLWYPRSLPGQLARYKHSLGKAPTLPALPGVVQRQSAGSNSRACSGKGVVDVTPWGAGSVSHVWMGTCRVYLVERGQHTEGVMHLSYFRCLPWDSWTKL